MFSFSSCVVFRPNMKKDNGLHKGWTKNPNNPHHPASTNPGQANKAPGSKAPVAKAPGNSGAAKSKGKK
jgi:hypothetical protein